MTENKLEQFFEAVRRAFSSVFRQWDGSPTRYDSTAQYCNACLINVNQASGRESQDDWVQSHCKLPVKNPGSDAFDFEGIQAAAGALAGARGGIVKPDDVSQDDWDSAVRSAANAVIQQYEANDAVAPDSVFEAAGKEPPTERAMSTMIADNAVWEIMWKQLPEAWYHGLYIDDDAESIYATYSLEGRLFRVPVSIIEGEVRLGQHEQVMEQHVPVTGRTKIVRQIDDRYRWFSVSAVAVLNRDGEIDSSELLQSFVDRIESGNDPYPYRDFYHLGKQFRTGQADYVARDGHVYITSGLYDDSEIARREVEVRLADPEGWGDSIEFLPDKGPDLEEIGAGVAVPVYRSGSNVAIATVRSNHAASLFTTAHINKEVKRMNERAMAAFVALFGDDEEAARNWLGQNVDATNRTIAEQGLVARTKTETNNGQDTGPELEVEIDDAVIAVIVERVKDGLPDPPDVETAVKDAVAAALLPLKARIDSIETQVEEAVATWQADMPESRQKTTVRYRPSQSQTREQAEDEENEERGAVALSKMKEVKK